MYFSEKLIVLDHDLEFYSGCKKILKFSMLQISACTDEVSWCCTITVSLFCRVISVLQSYRVSEVFRKNKKGGVIIPDDNIT
jgi:hypothetical protein